MLWEGKHSQTKGQVIKLSAPQNVPRASRRHFEGLHENDVQDLSSNAFTITTGLVCAVQAVDRRGKSSKEASTSTHTCLAGAAQEYIGNGNKRKNWNQLFKMPFTSSHTQLEDGSRTSLSGRRYPCGCADLLSITRIPTWPRSVILKTVESFE
jgi:hypothetical protein